MRRISLLSIIVFEFSLLSHPILSQTNGVSLVGHLYKPHGTSGQGTQFSACWGWVAPNGHEYALISTYEGVSIVDLGGDTLREVQFVPGTFPGQYIWREIKTYKQYAYVVSEGGSGVQIIDLSGLPDTAILVKNFTYVSNTPPDVGKSNARSHTVTVADGYLYCNGSASWSPAGCLIFSLRADPTNPEFVGQYQPDPANSSSNYIHDSYVRNDTLFGAAIYGAGGLYVADVHDKANPVTIAKIVYAGSGTHHAWESIDGHYAFTTDEITNARLDLKVWALDSLPFSAKVGEWIAEPTSIIHNVHGRGHYLYVSHYTAGMRVVDVHDPRNPVEAGYYDTYPGASGGYSGCWGVYPYFPSGKWIGSDMQTGLYVCKFNGLKARARVRLLNPPDSATTSNVMFRWTSAGDLNEDPHYYELHLRGGTLDTSIVTRDTSYQYASLPIGAFRWYVATRDEFTVVSSQDTFYLNHLGPVTVDDRATSPQQFMLKQNYPNPFNPLTRIEFFIPKASVATLKIYNSLGAEVRTLLRDEPLAAGKQEVVFDARNIPSGIYFYRLITPDFSETKAMVLAR